VDDQSFGGEWTESKLRNVKSYLEGYQQALKNQRFTLWYVDAFAGTGSRSAPEAVDTSNSLLRFLRDETDDEDEDAGRYRDGSAKIALALQRPFDRYLFIEKSKSKCDELQSIIKRDYAHLIDRCSIRQEDSNTALFQWCKERNWAQDRAVVFLDPFGLQVNWSTIESLGSTKAVDLWYLFPLSLLRLLKRDGQIEQSWRARLDSVFGTTEWESRFYERFESPLFEGIEVVQRIANADSVRGFIEERLRTCFAAVAKGKVLTNSKNSPLFLLCFAVANKNGAPIAMRIAQSILKG
jgi:three-Cys-motif partner protein